MKFASSTVALAALTTGAVADSPSRIFTFGSSWSANGFNPNGTQPSRFNVYGNTMPLITTDLYEAGPNYVEFLTTKYNTSETYLYDFAVGGATVASNQNNNTFVHQYNKEFKPHYANGKSFSPNSTLFVLFMGDNDVVDYYQNPAGGQSTNISRIQDIYWNQLVTNLYNDQARKFLIVSVPAQDQSPEIQQQTHGNPTQYLSYKNQYNAELLARMNSFASAHKDTQFSYYNSSAFMYPILADPTKYGFNKNASCSATDGSGQKDCIWRVQIHCNTHLHDLMAKDMESHVKSVGFYS